MADKKDKIAAGIGLGAAALGSALGLFPDQHNNAQQYADAAEAIATAQKEQQGAKPAPEVQTTTQQKD